MTAMQRNKRKAAEREVAAIVRKFTGWDVQRRMRQHGGDSDLVGIPGWAVEVRRHRTATRADLARWWAQAVAQACNHMPVLLSRLDRDAWRAMWPIAVLLAQQRVDYWRAYEWAVDSSVEAWAAVARDVTVAGPAVTAE